jgi:hypothetical protein
VSSQANAGKDSFPVSQPNTQLQSTDDLNVNKKRGLQMMSNINLKHAPPASAAGSSSSSTNKPSKDIFAALKNINMQKSKPNSSTEVSCTQQEKVKKAKLDCVICSSPPTNPFINECGHICCKACWYVPVQFSTMHDAEKENNTITLLVIVFVSCL